MAKTLYDDKAYLAAVEQINSAASTILDMEGSDISTVEDIFEQWVDSAEEDEGDDDE